MLSTISYQTLIDKVAKKLIPLRCLFELTYTCNLSCIHCYIVKNSKRKELTKNEIFKILDQLSKAGCLYLIFSGGEIFCRKDFFDIASYARKKNFALTLFTNGTLITKEMVERVKELYPLRVEISLYGFKNTHDKITRVPGSFEKTCDAINLLVEKRIKVLVKTALMRWNVDKIWRLKALVEKLGAKMRGVGGALLLSPCDDGNRRPLNYRLTDNQLKKYLREEFEQLKILGQNYKPREIKQNEKLCGAGFATSNITPYGELNPCVQIRCKDNGSRNRPLIEIWREHKEIVRLRNLHMVDKKDCWDCELISYCFVCPGVALLEQGSLLAKLPEACRQARIRKEICEKGLVYG